MTARQRSHQWKTRVARERRRLTRDPSLAVCWLCGNPIDMELPVDHQSAFTLDHVVPVARAGNEAHGEARPAHRHCNASRGDGHRSSTEPQTLLDW